jgi:hypothetical protein
MLIGQTVAAGILMRLDALTEGVFLSNRKIPNGEKSEKYFSWHISPKAKTAHRSG